MLGDFLTNLSDEATATEAILRSGNLQLLTAAREQPAAEGLVLGAYITQAVQRYANEASDEEWITLIGLLNRAPDPGAACLQRALACSLQLPS
jgi:hypothetical protein